MEGREGWGENWQRLMGKIGSASTRALTSSEKTLPLRICDGARSLRAASQLLGAKHLQGSKAGRCFKELPADHRFAYCPYLN